ncbi:hypothetical protein ACN94_05160 [Gordonia paraffinivorans]|uniref:ankyrin repeat domain-containing protein n=1 Tax=Gordonia paraffinivorans TaxID=175628 RepID=UPI000A05E910|nr:hypothetical protein [Gordonia paraffinivorans]
MTCATIADRTPLHFAAQDDTVAVARLLAEYGADVNARNDHDNTPLREPIRRAGRGRRTTDDQGAERRPVRTPSLRNEHGENILEVPAVNAGTAACSWNCVPTSCLVNTGDRAVPQSAAGRRREPDAHRLRKTGRPVRIN